MIEIRLSEIVHTQCDLIWMNANWLKLRHIVISNIGNVHNVTCYSYLFEILHVISIHYGIRWITNNWWNVHSVCYNYFFVFVLSYEEQFIFVIISIIITFKWDDIHKIRRKITTNKHVDSFLRKRRNFDVPAKITRKMNPKQGKQTHDSRYLCSFWSVHAEYFIMKEKCVRSQNVIKYSSICACDLFTWFFYYRWKKKKCHRNLWCFVEKKES